MKKILFLPFLIFVDQAFSNDINDIADQHNTSSMSDASCRLLDDLHKLSSVAALKDNYNQGLCEQPGDQPNVIRLNEARIILENSLEQTRLFFLTSVTLCPQDSIIVNADKSFSFIAHSAYTEYKEVAQDPPKNSTEILMQVFTSPLLYALSKGKVWKRSPIEPTSSILGKRVHREEKVSAPESSFGKKTLSSWKCIEGKYKANFQLLSSNQPFVPGQIDDFLNALDLQTITLFFENAHIAPSDWLKKGPDGVFFLDRPRHVKYKSIDWQDNPQETLKKVLTTPCLYGVWGGQLWGRSFFTTIRLRA